MLTPASLARLRQAGIEVTVEAQNVQQMIDQSYAHNDEPLTVAAGELGPFFAKVQPLDAVEAHLKELVGKAGGRAKLSSVGRSIEGRDIHAVLISSHPEDANRASIIVTGTQHAREWMSRAHEDEGGQPVSPPMKLGISLLTLALLVVGAGCAKDSEDCRGPGRYEAGKEGSYRPCCQPLTEVFYQKPATSNGAPVCTSPPLRVYACVRGTCGDGVCKAGEAPHCGCTTDCPSTVWGPSDEPAPPHGGARD